MKKTILILLAALLALSLSAQSRYSVYKTRGSVRICPKSETDWVDVTWNRVLQLGDLLHLEERSSITILDSSNSMLYMYEKVGECTVMEAVRAVRDKAGSLTCAVLAEMKRDIKGSPAEATYDVVGVSYRGQDSVAYTDSLAVSLRQVASRGVNNAQLALQLVPEEDAMLFRLRNNADTPLYINVLRISSGELTVCLEFDGKEGSEGLLLDTGTEILLDQYPFLVQDGANYLVYGTLRYYDTRSLQRALRRSDTGEALKAGFIY